MGPVRKLESFVGRDSEKVLEETAPLQAISMLALTILTEENRIQVAELSKFHRNDPFNTIAAWTNKKSKMRNIDACLFPCSTSECSQLIPATTYSGEGSSAQQAIPSPMEYPQ